MNAQELQHKLESKLEGKQIYKVIFIVSLINLVVFPINYWFNPNVDPIVYESPVWFGLGFIAFAMMFIVAYAGGISTMLILLDWYLYASPKVLDRYGKLNSRVILRDDNLLDRMSNGIHKRLERLRYSDFTLQINEVKEGLQYQINKLKQQIAELTKEIKELRKENQEIKTDYMRAFKIQNLKYEQSERRRIHAEGELEKAVELNKKYEQLLNDRTLTKNSDKNTKIKKSDKIEFLDD